MAEIDPVILELKVEYAKAQVNLRNITRVTEQQFEAQGRAISVLEGRMDKGFTRIGQSAAQSQAMLGTSLDAIKKAMAGFVTVDLARRFLSMADEAKKLDATLKLATAGFGSFGQAQKDVRSIADETRSGLSETASLYANFVRGAKELGGTQADASRATETFSKTLKISGADANEAASATLQFGQALAAGALRGDELNSILEASPRLARLLAESMGQPIGQIKKLGEEGKLTSDKLLKALTDQKFTAGIDAEFKQLPMTFDDAMTRLSNAAMVTFSAFDRGGEFSTALANFVSDGSDGFSALEQSALDFGITVRSEFDGLIATFRQAVETVDTLGGAFDSLTQGPVGQFVGKLNEIAGYLNPIAQLVELIRGNSAYKGAAEESRTKAQRREGERWIQQASSGYDILGNPKSGMPGGGRTTPSVPASTNKKNNKSPLNPDAFAREEASLNDEILRLKRDQATTIEESSQIELNRIAASKAAAIEDINNDKRYTAEQKAKVIALTETVAAMQAAKTVRERDEALAKRQYDLETAANANSRDMLESQLQLASTREEQFAIEQRILKLKQSQERAELELLAKSTDLVEAAKANAALATLDQRQSNDTEALNRQYESPLASYRREITDAGKNLDDKYESIAVDGLQSLNDGLTDAIMNAKNFGDVFGNVAKQVIADLIRMAVQQTVVAGLMKSLGGLFGGSSAPSASPIVNMSAWGGFDGARASGGPVKAGKTYLVGENGPEIFTADQSGTIVPNHQIAAASAMTGVSAAQRSNTTQVTQVLQLDLSNAVLTPELLNQMNSMAQSAAVGGAMAGSKDAQASLAKRSRNRIP